MWRRTRQDEFKKMGNRVDRLDGFIDVEANVCEEMIQTGYGYINGRLVENRGLIEQSEDGLSDRSTLGARVLGLARCRHCRRV